MSMSRVRELIVDSIADGLARLEEADGRFLTLPEEWLPAGCREGDVLRCTPESGRADVAVRIARDSDATAARRTRIRSKLDVLRERGSS